MASDRRIANEVEHGRRIADRAGEVWNWETPAGVRRWRRRVAMLTGDVASSHEVLEVGCGTGYFTRELAATGANTTAIDISPDLLARARREVPAANVRFVEGNAYATGLDDASFDRVIGSSVLHHLELEPALAEFRRLLRPGGRLAFTEPNMLNPQIAVQKNVPPIKRWLGDSPDETAFVRWSLERSLRAHGFANVAIECFDFLHPQIPGFLVDVAVPLCALAERVPVLREIAGSLFIRATAPTG